MRIDRRSALRALLAAGASARVRLFAQRPLEPAWLLSGAVTDASAVVKANFVERLAAAPPLLVGTDRGLEGARAVEGVSTPSPTISYPNRTTVTYRLDGLEPSTEYFAGLRPGTGTLARFRTFPRGPSELVVAFSSCAGGTRLVPMSNVSNSGVFAALASLDPHLFIHMGDLHYYNISGPAEPVEEVAGLFRRAFDRVLSQERQALFYRRTPLVYVWDDHDYGRDDSDARAPTRAGVRRFYASDVPHYPTPLSPAADGPIAQTFDAGRVRFLVTDVRSERSPAERTMLGARQREWFLAELERAAQDAVPLVVWVNTVPWITADGDSEGWGRFADERRLIGERIRALGLSDRLIVLSGDAHMLAFDDGRNNRHGGFVVAQAAPLDRFLRKKGGPYSHDPPSQQNGQFGVLRITDDGTTVTAQVEGHRYDGQGSRGRSTPVPGVALTLRCTEDGGQIVSS